MACDRCNKRVTEQRASVELLPGGVSQLVLGSLQALLHLPPLPLNPRQVLTQNPQRALLPAHVPPSIRQRLQRQTTPRGHLAHIQSRRVQKERAAALPVWSGSVSTASPSARWRERRLGAAERAAGWTDPGTASGPPAPCSEPDGAPHINSGNAQLEPEHSTGVCVCLTPNSTGVCVLVHVSLTTISSFSCCSPLFRLATSSRRPRLSTSAECSRLLKSRKCCWRLDTSV